MSYLIPTAFITHSFCMRHSSLLTLMTRQLSGEASPAETEQLQALLASDAALAAEYRALQRFWGEATHEQPQQVAEGLQKVLQTLQLPANTAPVPSPRKRKSTLWYLAAAVLACLLCAGLIYKLGFGNASPATYAGTPTEQKQNSKGTRSVMVLADGSKVWLNADSKISYPALFAGNTREISLSGEAFFQVAHNPQKPFIIHLKKGTIRVLGTSFNVRAYENEAVVETSVATGRVAFVPRYQKRSRPADTLFVKADEKVQFRYTDEAVELLPAMPAVDRAWTEGKLIFKAMTLRDIARDLERYFDKKVVIVDDEAGDFLFTGSFQNNSLEEIMYYLSLSKQKKIYYRITGAELRIATLPSRL